MASVASTYIVFKRLNFFNISACFKVCKNSLSCFKSCHTCIFAAIEYLRLVLSSLTAFNNFIGSLFISLACHMTVISECTDNRKVMTKPYLKVVRVMSRSNFNNTCTLSHICMLVTYNRNFLI